MLSGSLRRALMAMNGGTLIGIGKRGKQIRTIAVSAAVGLILGIAGTIFVLNFNPPDQEPGLTATTVFERIVSKNELVSVSQNYNITEKQNGDPYTFFGLFDLPFTSNNFWYRYAGTLKAGVSLETANIESQGNTVVIEMDAPYIISNTPDMEISGVLEENNNALNPIHVEDVDAFQKWCVEKSEQDAIKGGLLDEARTEAVNHLAEIFNAALGEECVVEVHWRDEGSDAATE